MTRTELIENNKQLAVRNSQMNKWFLGGLAVLVLAMATLDATHMWNLEDTIDIHATLIVICVCWMVGILLYFGCRIGRQRRELGLYCPHCQKNFVGLSTQVVVATGRCGRCGGIILSDWNK